MLLAIYGKVDLHDHIDPTIFEEDAYSLFVARGAMMGWTLDDPIPAWGMNDAGQSWTGGLTSPRAAWFQIGLADPLTTMGLPIQPFLQCGVDVVRRVAELSVTAVQFLIPLQLGAVRLTDLVTQRPWFAAAHPESCTSVRITIESGEGGEDVLSRAANIQEMIHRSGSGPVTIDSWTSDPEAPVTTEPPVLEGLWWLGEGRHPLTLAGTAVEWTTDIVGHAAALVAWACREAGVATPVAVSIERSS